jgi:hypothetical protein
MDNCKKDFLDEVAERKVQVLCAEIIYFKKDHSERRIHLPVGFTKDEYALFLHNIDFMYDAGYGGQEVCGTIWYQDGTWSERAEYDGSEWWVYKSCPNIPDYLRKDQDKAELKNEVNIKEKVCPNCGVPAGCRHIYGVFKEPEHDGELMKDDKLIGILLRIEKAIRDSRLGD